MKVLHLPWLELTILIPLIGAILVCWLKNQERVQRWSLCFSAASLLTALGGWRDFVRLNTFAAHDRWDLFSRLFHEDLFVIDELSAPLIPLSALIYFLTLLITLRTKSRRFSFAWTLVSEAILLATLSCRQPEWIVVFLILGVIPVYAELLHRKKPTRVYLLHMGLFATLLIIGQSLITINGQPTELALIFFGLAVLLRNGAAPVHCWMTDLFEHASFGTALLFVTPMIGAYAAMRLVLPFAPLWIMQAIAVVSLLTALYAAGMALVQTEARRFFTYLFLSFSSLVLVGLEIATPIGLTGGLCIWLSVGLSLAGFGLTLRAIESRMGRISLAEFHGLYHKTPFLAGFFLLTGMASIGFPGTIGFVGTELLVDGAGQISLWIETLIVLTTALNSIAVLMVYFKVFTGKPRNISLLLNCRTSERLTVLLITVLILGGGFYPQPGIKSRYHAAVELLADRERFLKSQQQLPDQPTEMKDSHGSWLKPGESKSATEIYRKDKVSI